MVRLNILCGLNDIDEFNEVEQKVGNILTEHGYSASFQLRDKKTRIREYIEDGECDVVILQERIDNKKWTAEEVAQLTEQGDVHVIIVLSERYIGKEYLRTLLAANITNAIFQKGRNGGASAKDIADLIMKRRSRKDAREYYGIGGQIDLGFLDEDAYITYYNDLRNESESLIKNYVDVCAKMSPIQIADFTRRLPEDDLDELVKYEEFHTVIQLLKKMKIGKDLDFKKPKKAMVGLKVPQLITFKSNEGANTERPKCDNNEPEKKEESPRVSISDEDMENMSLEDLLAFVNGEYIPQEVVAEEPEEMVVAEESSPGEEGIEEEKKLEFDSSEKIEERKEPIVQDKVVKEETVQTLQVSEEELTRIRAEVAEEEKNKFDKKLREVHARNVKAMEKQKEELLRRQHTIIDDQEAEHWDRVNGLLKKQRRLEKKLERATYDDYVLDSGSKQFSWGIIVLLLLLVAAALGLLYYKPLFIGTGFIW